MSAISPSLRTRLTESGLLQAATTPDRYRLTSLTIDGQPLPDLEAEDAIGDPGVIGGGGFDDDAAPIDVIGEEESLQLGGEVILAGLAAHHNGERVAAAVADGIEDGERGLKLVVEDAPADDVAAKEGEIEEGTAEAARIRGIGRDGRGEPAALLA